MVKIHQLKVTHENWGKYDTTDDMWSIRHNDRDFKEGEYCQFQCIDAMDHIGQEQLIFKRINSILKHKDFPKGLKKDYCILSLHHNNSISL